LFGAYSEFIWENAIEITNKHAPKRETDLPRIQDFILSTSYGRLPMLTYKFPEDRQITAEDVADFQKHQKMAFIAARGFIVVYELIGNLRKADWYNKVCSMKICSYVPVQKKKKSLITFGSRHQFNFGVLFKHLKLMTTNRFGEFITDKDMTGAMQACKDAYKAWCQAKGIVYSTCNHAFACFQTFW
jgi:hypothetical protein